MPTATQDKAVGAASLADSVKRLNKTLIYRPYLRFRQH